MTDSSAYVLSKLRPADRQEVMSDLFSPSQGIGISMLRQPMGASDFAVGAGVLLRRPAREADRPRPVRLQHPPRSRLHPAAAAGGVRAESQAHLHGHAVECAGLDEDQRLHGHGLAAAALPPGVRELLREVHPGLPAGRDPHRLRLDAERTAVRTGRLPRHGRDAGSGGDLHRPVPRADPGACRTRSHPDPWLRPQLGRDRVPRGHVCRSGRRSSGRRHGVALLRRRCGGPVDLAQQLSARTGLPDRVLGWSVADRRAG